jgi:hypothetical protein
MLPEILFHPLAPLTAAALAVAVTVAVGTRYRLGPASDWVEVVRRVALPVLDPFIERYVGGAGAAYTLGSREHAARVDASPEELETWLWERGLRRNVLSAYKTTGDDRSQVGAWVYRGDAVGPKRQLDVMLFRTPDGQTDVFAHVEFSSALRWLREDPTVLKRHYQADEYDPAAGGEMLREWLSESAFEWNV